MNIAVYGLVEGLMIYWDEVKDAAQYHVHLFIGDWKRHIEVINGQGTIVNDKKESIKEIAMVDVDRNFKYYSFQGLARIHVEYTASNYGRVRNETGRHYYVLVEAEDRTGKIIDSSDKKQCNVLENYHAED